MNSQEQVNYQEGINDFASAHDATVDTVMSLQQQNLQLNQIFPAIQQQIKILYTQLRNMRMANATTYAPPTQAYQHSSSQGSRGRRGGVNG